MATHHGHASHTRALSKVQALSRSLTLRMDCVAARGLLPLQLCSRATCSILLHPLLQHVPHDLRVMVPWNLIDKDNTTAQPLVYTDLWVQELMDILFRYRG